MSRSCAWPWTGRMLRCGTGRCQDDRGQSTVTCHHRQTPSATPVTPDLQAPPRPSSPTPTSHLLYKQQPTRQRHLIFTTSVTGLCFHSVCLFVCLSTGLREYYSTDFHRIQWKGHSPASKRWLNFAGSRSRIFFSWRRSIVVRTLVSARELSCARLLVGWVTTLRLSRPLLVSQHDQLSQPSLSGR